MGLPLCFPPSLAPPNLRLQDIFLLASSIPGKSLSLWLQAPLVACAHFTCDGCVNQAKPAVSGCAGKASSLPTPPQTTLGKRLCPKPAIVAAFQLFPREADKCREDFGIPGQQNVWERYKRQNTVALFTLTPHSHKIATQKGSSHIATFEKQLCFYSANQKWISNTQSTPCFNLIFNAAFKELFVKTGSEADSVDVKQKGT